MGRFDDPGVYYNDPLYSEDGQSEADTDESNTFIYKKNFQYDFLRDIYGQHQCVLLSAVRYGYRTIVYFVLCFTEALKHLTT